MRKGERYVASWSNNGKSIDHPRDEKNFSLSISLSLPSSPMVVKCWLESGRRFNRHLVYIIHNRNVMEVARLYVLFESRRAVPKIAGNGARNNDREDARFTDPGILVISCSLPRLFHSRVDAPSEIPGNVNENRPVSCCS